VTRDAVPVGGGQTPWPYVWCDVPRPYVHPVSTPAGHVLSREAPADHPWHHALWFTIKFVDGDNFWEEMPPFGLLVHEEPPQVDGHGAVSGWIHWRRPDGELALRSHRTLARHAWGAPAAAGTSVDATVAVDAWVLDWTEVLVAGDAPVVLDRTPFEGWGGYGGLTLRGPGDWIDTRLMLDDGTTHDRVLGPPSRWCDLTGMPAGASTGKQSPDSQAGVLICDHPDNPRHPVPFYASTRAATYGDEGWSNFCNAAFLWAHPLTIDAGGELVVRHRVVVHDGVWSAERCEDVWRDWVGEAP
jgi:hypothetical protein